MGTVDTRRARDRSIGELFGELAHETTTLVKQEVRLATTEVAAKATYAAKKSTYIVVGALLGIVSLVVFAAALVVILAHVIPLWASALVVSIVFGVIAFAVARIGITALKDMSFTLDETVASLKEDKQWMTRLTS